MLSALAWLDLIRFRRHRHYRNAVTLEPVTQLLILLCRSMAEIDNMHHSAERLTLLQIGFDHWSPSGLDGTRHLSIPISGQIDEQKTLINQKKS
jgi:hypothetical protein